MKYIVQKFGGTSISNKDNRKRAIEKIKGQVDNGYKVVVVVSAMGREGEPYATDTLLNLINLNYSDNREIDLLMSCGEIISSVILSNLLNENKISNRVLTGLQAGIITNNNYGDANVITVNPKRIFETLNNHDVVVVAGFQGGTEDLEITTLGRGGSDTTAVIIGEAINCEFVEIYTDVDGVMTADPRIVPDAKVLYEITYDELFQLAEDGAKVIHPRAVEIAERSNIIIKIKNTMNQGKGTLVVRKNQEEYNKKNKENTAISSIAFKKSRCQVTISKITNKFEIKNIMGMISKHNISIDLINFSLEKCVFTIEEKEVNKVKEILESSKCEYKIINNCCKISLVGNNIKGTPGVMFRILNCLYNQNIEVLQTSDSYNTIWCLIYEKDLDKSIKTLHEEFNLSKK